jgi:hypothetical protein
MNTVRNIVLAVIAAGLIDPPLLASALLRGDPILRQLPSRTIATIRCHHHRHNAGGCSANTRISQGSVEDSSKRPQESNGVGKPHPQRWSGIMSPLTSKIVIASLSPPWSWRDACQPTQSASPNASNLPPRTNGRKNDHDR